MTAVRYGIGLGALVLVVAGVVAAARQLRARLVPGAAGSVAAVVDTVLALSLLTVGLQVLGTVGALSLPGVAVVALAVGAAAWWSRDAGGSPRGRVVGVGGRRPGWLAAATGGLLATVWVAGTAPAFNRGITTYDSTAYHLPHAARFLQTGRTTGLHTITPEVPLEFHPANGELLHTLGMLGFGTDLLSPAINLGWLALAGLAAWAIGDRAGRGWTALALLAPVLVSPVMVHTQPGSAYTDVAVIALVLASVAVLLRGPPTLGAVTVSGLAAGFAVGTKLSAAAPAALLTVAVVATAPRGRRARTAVTWTAAAFVAGGYWYLRNLWHTGSPLPSVDLGIGPLRLPHLDYPLLDEAGYAVAHYLTEPEVWRRVFLPGLDTAFGPLWWALVGLGAAGLVVPLVRAQDHRVRAFAAAGLLALAAYAVTPTTAFGYEGDPEPVLFVANLRYATPALALGSALLALSPGLTGWRRRGAVAAALGVAVAATWAAGTVRPSHAATALVLVASVAALRTAPLVVRLTRRPAVVGVVAVSVVAGGWMLAGHYLSNRYQNAGPAGVREQWRWAQGVEGATIAEAGRGTPYPLFGTFLTNHVERPVRPDALGAEARITTCEGWLTALADGGFDHVVTAPNVGTPDQEPPEADWTRADPGAVELFHRERAAVFRLTRPPDPRACSR